MHGLAAGMAPLGKSGRARRSGVWDEWLDESGRLASESNPHGYLGKFPIQAQEIAGPALYYIIGKSIRWPPLSQAV